MFAPRRIKRTGPTTFRIRLPDEERQLLASLVPQLRQLLETDLSDPSLKRLFPTAYAEDPELEEEYRELTRDDLVESRRQTLETVAATATADEVDEEQLLGWMGAVNDLRLVLGTRLDVSEDTDFDVDPEHPDAPGLAVYGYLGYLLEEIVAALSG
jgi:hypothetical protein